MDKFRTHFLGDLKPGQISNMDLHVKYLHDGIITAANQGAELFALRPLMNMNRVSKAFEEVDSIRKASEIACEGLLDTMAASVNNQSESYLSALFEFGFG